MTLRSAALLFLSPILLLASAAHAAPAVTTTDATGLTLTGATLHGSVVSDRVLPYFLGFRYGVDQANLDLATTGGPFTGGAGSTTPVDQAVSSLSCSTTYYFAAVATEPSDNTLSAGTRGDVFSFRTLDCPGPSVTTFVPDGITANSAVLHGQINPNGTTTNAFFDLGTAPGSLNVPISAGQLTGSSAQAIAATPNNLSCGTTYYFQARGTDTGNNTVVGTTRNFTTSACANSAPVVTTQAASGLTTTSATLNATVNPSSLATTAQFEYGSSPGSLNQLIDKGSIGSGSSDVAITGAASGLSCGTTYYFRAKATNSVNTMIGATLSFATSACPTGQPTAVTDSAVTSQTTATFNGNVNPNGVATDTFFDYGTSAGTLNLSASAGNIGSGSAPQPISAGVAGLTCGTTYFYRARGVNSVGTGLGATQSVPTGSCAVTPPTATTGAASSITASGASLAGTVNPNGSAASGFFDFGLTANTLNQTANAGSAGAGNAAVPISTGLVNLSCGTQYFYRARGTNAGGSGMGSTLNFTTSACPATAPTVSTDPPTTNGSGMPVLHATVNPNRADTQAFFDYSVTPGLFNTTLAVGSVGSGNSPVTVNGTPSLACGTTFYGRARAVNSAGTGLGVQVTFSTPPCQCKVGSLLICGSVDNWANNNAGSTTSNSTYTCKTSGINYSGETGPEFTYSFRQQICGSVDNWAQQREHDVELTYTRKTSGINYSGETGLQLPPADQPGAGDRHDDAHQRGPRPVRPQCARRQLPRRQLHAGFVPGRHLDRIHQLPADHRHLLRRHGRWLLEQRQRLQDPGRLQRDRHVQGRQRGRRRPGLPEQRDRTQRCLRQRQRGAGPRPDVWPAQHGHRDRLLQVHDSELCRSRH